jgi:O-antigen ligase
MTAATTWGILQRDHADSRSVAIVATTAVTVTIAATALGAAYPLVSVAAVVATGVAIAAIHELVVGLYVLVALAYSEIIPAAAEGVTLAKVAGVVVLLGWLTARVRQPETRRGSFVRRHQVTGAALAAFLAWAGVSLLWVPRPHAGAGTLLRYILVLVLIPIVYSAVRSRVTAQRLAALLALGALASAGYGFFSGGAFDYRLAGAGFNADQLGSLLIPAVVTFTAFSAGAVGALRYRIAAAPLAAASLIATALTLSRGALIGLGACALLGPIVAGRGRRLATTAGVVGAALVVVVTLVTLAPAADRTRILHPGGGSGRRDLWTMAGRLIARHPLTGVGVGGFRDSSVRVLVEPGVVTRDEYVLDDPKPPHNIYLEVLAELGVVGAAVFAVAIAALLMTFAQAWRLCAVSSDKRLELLCRGLFVGVVGFLVAETFESELFLKQLWVLLALGPATLAIARESHENLIHRYRQTAA